MDQQKSMQVFRAVAQCKSFSQAAEHLDLPRPTVTNAIQHLEQQLGVRLLQRTTRKVSLTAEGSLYLERCVRVLDELDDMAALFSDKAPRGTIRVDLPERVARLHLIPRLPEFFRQYPDIQVRLGASDRYVDLVGEGIDCAIRVGSLRDSRLIAKRIGQMEQINVAAPAYLAQHGTPQNLADLAQHYAVNFFSSKSGRDMDWEYQLDGQAHSLTMRSLISVTSTEAYLAACQAGLGLIQAPRLGLEALLANGELIEVLPGLRAAPLPVAIVYSHHKQLTPRVRVFVDWVVSVFTPS